MPRHSKVQIQVLSLYRHFLRAAKDKPGIIEHIKQEFKKNSVIPRHDILRIEHLMRRGERQLDLVKNTGVKGMGVFQKE